MGILQGSGFPKIRRTLLEVATIRTIVYWVHPLFLGNSHLGLGVGFRAWGSRLPAEVLGLGWCRMFLGCRNSVNAQTLSPKPFGV